MTVSLLQSFSGAVYYQYSPAQLVEMAIARQEGILGSNGALYVETGEYTGRSPLDRYVVDTPGVHADVLWGDINRPIAPEVFEQLWQKACSYAATLPELFVFDGFCGADPAHRLPVRFINEQAHHNLFVHQLFIRPEQPPQKCPPETSQEAFTVLSLPGLHFNGAADGVHSEAAVVVDIEGRRVLVAATSYAGEMKKAMFSVMNYLMPLTDVLPMHCSANTTADGKGPSALFFGLSGTGKTTLSADPNRMLIGDDEHGWGSNGVFNFEGGCYAKTIRLSHEHEPEIWEAIRFGSLVENVVVHPATRQPNYDDGSLTENGRVGYPIDFIPNASITGMAAHPSVVIFLTADAFGVLPPISRLTLQQAADYFVMGYTSKVAGTERGITEPKAVFSHCFGAPFMPRPASVYAKLLQEKLQAHQATVYLVNTGWQGGEYGVGHRISIPHTRAMITAALEGTLASTPTCTHPVFGLEVPMHCPGVPDAVLDPKKSWADPDAYDATAQKLNVMFAEALKVHATTA